MIDDRPGPGDRTRFLTLLFSFCALDLLSWPILFSYYLWVFADRSNFLNLDYMLDQHLRLGVDAFYSYGLLPVLLQHVLFVVFGRGYWPMIGCNLVVLVLFSVFWSSFVRIFCDRWIFLLTVVALSPFLMCVNLILPYQMVQASILFALLFLLKGRPEIALAISVIGCFSVPSLPLVLTGLLALYIAVDWWTGGDRSFLLLVRRFAPGALTYLLLAAVLSAFFGVRSLLVSVLPFLGVKFYYGSGKADFTDLFTFLHPAGHSFKYYVAYYIGSAATWWILCTIGLVIVGCLAAGAMIRNRRVDPKNAFILFCAMLQLFFALIAYRAVDQHGIYDPITAAGSLAGIAVFSSVRRRNLILILFAAIGVLGQAIVARHTLSAWKTTHPSPYTANLYAEAEYAPEMANILKLAETHKVLLVSHATGVHHYYPPTKSVDSWFVMAPLMYPSDEDRVLEKMREADIVVEDINHVPWFLERDPRAVSLLRSMCLTESSHDFAIRWRHPPESTICKADPIPAKAQPAHSDDNGQAP